MEAKDTRSLLRRVLLLLRQMRKCDECVAPIDAACHRHEAEVRRLEQDVREALGSWPN